MKKDDLFQGAIVLARKYAFKKRTRCKIIEVGRSHSVVQNQRGYKFVTEQKDLRPAKITRNALKEIGFEERETRCHRRIKPVCIEYVYPNKDAWPEDAWPWAPRIIMNDECDQWGPTRIFGGLGIHKVSYIHEVQRVINKIKNQK